MAPSSASSLSKEHFQIELELRLLEALDVYPPVKLRGAHRNFVLYGLMECLKRRFDRNFSADEVPQLLDRFFNLEMLKPDEEDMNFLNHEEEFCLPHSYSLCLLKLRVFKIVVLKAFVLARVVDGVMLVIAIWYIYGLLLSKFSFMYT